MSECSDCPNYTLHNRFGSCIDQSNITADICHNNGLSYCPNELLGLTPQCVSSCRDECPFYSIRNENNMCYPATTDCHFRPPSNDGVTRNKFCNLTTQPYSSTCVSDCNTCSGEGDQTRTRNIDHIWNLPIQNPETGLINHQKANICSDYNDLISADIFTEDGSINCQPILDLMHLGGYAHRWKNARVKGIFFGHEEISNMINAICPVLGSLSVDEIRRFNPAYMGDISPQCMKLIEFKETCGSSDWYTDLIVFVPELDDRINAITDKLREIQRYNAGGSGH